MEKYAVDKDNDPVETRALELEKTSGLSTDKARAVAAQEKEKDAELQHQRDPGV